MGIFDIFRRKSDAPRPRTDKELAKLAKLVGDKLSQNFDRQEAIQVLSRDGSAPAVEALLRRFTWALDPSITDQEEKEAVVEGVVAAGAVAVEPIRRFCKTAESVTWPLKALRQLLAEEQFFEEVAGLLDGFSIDYVRNAEPKVQLLQTLEEAASTRCRDSAVRCMDDASEPVRFAAVTTVFAIGDASVLPKVIDLLEAEESLRVRNRIALLLSERNWPLDPELLARCRAALPDDFAVVDQQVVKRY